MSDVSKSSYELKLLAGFVDEDDRTLTIPNPKSNLTWTDISAFASVAANAIVGDKYGAEFSRIKSAKYVQTTNSYLDV